MNIKYRQPGDPCSFYFENYKELMLNEEAIIVFDAKDIEIIEGTVADKKGVLPIYKNYSGAVLMKKQFFRDFGFLNFKRGRSRNSKAKPPLMQGHFQYTYKTKLHLDIDVEGRVWLVDRTFYINELHETIKNLKSLNPKNYKKIRKLEAEIEKLEVDEVYRKMYARTDGDPFNDWNDKGDCEGLQEEAGRDEINRMNLETDGFWNVD